MHIPRSGFFHDLPSGKLERLEPTAFSAWSRASPTLPRFLPEVFPALSGAVPPCFPGLLFGLPCEQCVAINGLPRPGILAILTRGKMRALGLQHVPKKAPAAAESRPEGDDDRRPQRAGLSPIAVKRVGGCPSHIFLRKTSLGS
jgi:hypothetical protein